MPLQARQKAGRFILCSRFWEAKNPIDTTADSATYPYSPGEAYTEGQRLDIWRLHNRLGHFDMRCIGPPGTSAEGETPTWKL